MIHRDSRPAARLVFVVCLTFGVLATMFALQAQMREGGDEKPAATQPATSQPSDHHGDADKARSEYKADASATLEDHMEVLEDHVRALRRMVPRQEMNAQSLPRVIEMQHATLRAKALMPRKTDLVPEDKRDTFTLEYRKQMAMLLGNLVDLEVALLNDDNEAARVAFAAVLKSRFDGHREYRVDDD